MQVAQEVRESGRPANQVPVDRRVNLEEEIRRRAYELYLQRAATVGNGNGDQNQDWLIAEREVRSRLAGQERSTM